MTKTADLTQQLVQARNELNNLRKTIRGLQAEHRKDVSELKEVIAGAHNITPSHKPPKPCQQQAITTDDHLFHDWRPIGHIRSWFRTKNGTPRQGSVSSLTRGVLRLAPHTFTNPHHALQGLEDFSHVWILFVFDKNDDKGRSHRRSKVAPPRLGGQRVGVFGTRSPHRPNPLGLTLARLDKVEGDCLHLSGLDILDGTPVLDIKPYILQYDAPPMVASHFTDPTRVTSCKRLDEGLDSFNQDDRIQGGESTDEISEGETRPKGNEDVGALHREKCSHELSNDESKCMCDENVKNEKPRLKHSHDKSESNDEILKSQNKIKGMPADEKENVQVVTYETPAMSQSTDKAGMDMEPSDFVRHTNLYSEQNEKDEKEREMLDAHGDIEESEEGRDAEKVRNEKEIRTKEVVHFPGDTKESEECQDKSTVKEMSEGKGKESQHEEGDERSGGNRTNVQIASWVSEPPTASLQVIFNPIAVQQVEAFSCQAQDEKYRLEYLADGEELRKAITSVLRQDPRSVYRREKCPSLLYYLSVDTAHITAWFEGACAEVLRVQPLSMQSYIPVQQSAS